MTSNAVALIRRISLPLLGVALLMTGCSTPVSEYRRPEFTLPAAGPAGSTSTHGLNQWWKVLNDPVLEALVLEALRNNQDLAVAVGRVEEARALAGIARASLLPALDSALGVIRYPTQDLAVSGPRLRGNGPSDDMAAYQLAIVASYEVDVWGKLREADQAARARLLAQEATRAVVRIALELGVMQTYVGLRALDAQLEVAQAGLETRALALRLQRKRAELGAIDMIELYRAEAALDAAMIAAVQAQRAVATTESALAVMLGRAPTAIQAPVIARGADIDALDTQMRLPDTLPSDLLARRPDIVAAEQMLIAANADVEQARAAYFPSLKLEVALNSAAALTSPAALLWNLGSSALQPLFRGGALDASLAGSQARRAQAEAGYVRVVQTAFHDLHDALIHFHSNGNILDMTRRRATSMNESLRLAGHSRRLGRIADHELLAMQWDQLQTRAAVIDAQRARADALLAVIKALGGGWDGTSEAGRVTANDATEDWQASR